MSAPKFRRQRVSRPRAEPKLQTMLDHVAEGIAMFDDGQRLTVWNKRLQEILNVDDLAGGRTLQDLLRFMAERGDFGTNAAATEAMIGEHVTALDQPFVTERMLADGRVIEFRRTPLGGGAVVMICTEVTERRHTEYLLQDSTRELRAMLEKAPVALAVIGQEDRAIKHANARFRWLFGLTDSKSAERASLDLYLSAVDQDRILSAAAERRPVDFETEVERADGSKIWALIAAVRFIFEWEPAVLTSFHDISDRRRAETGLREELNRKRAELAEARTLQLELAPPPFRGCVGNFAISIDVLLEPAKEVGGDLVDHFQISNLLVLVLGDVSNKGAGAALFMARAHSLIRGIAARPDAEALFRTPEKVVGLINATLAKDNATCMFLTLFLASLDTRSGQLVYVRAGHIAPFLRRANGTLLRLTSAGGQPLGIMEHTAHRSFELDLCLGDQLLIITDGITEATDEADAQFGEARVAAFLTGMAAGEARPLARLANAVRAFEAGRPPFDDVAALFVEIAEAMVNPS